MISGTISPMAHRNESTVPHLTSNVHFSIFSMAPRNSSSIDCRSSGCTTLKKRWPAESFSSRSSVPVISLHFGFAYVKIPRKSIRNIPTGEIALRILMSTLYRWDKPITFLAFCKIFRSFYYSLLKLNSHTGDIKMCVDSRNEFSRMEWLRQVIVSSS